MNSSLSFFVFYDYCRELFSCDWLKAPLANDFFAVPSLGQSLIGLINHFHAPCISVIDYHDTIEQYDFSGSSLVFMTNMPHLKTYRSMPLPNIPIIGTNIESYHVIESLLAYLQKNLRQPLSHHGVMMDIFGKGVLILGPSGIGKSECAMQLLSLGHRLVSDDIVYFYRAKYNQLIGYSPPSLFNLLEIRGLGAIDVQQLHGPCSVQSEKILDLAITLYCDKNEPEARPLKKELGKKIISNVAVPHLSLNLTYKRELAILIECAVQFAFCLPSTSIDKLLVF